jgi:hypothetical protein
MMYMVHPARVSATPTPFPCPSRQTPRNTRHINCNVAQFITDVTIPDGTVMTPSQAFTKKWRFKNIGSCTWTGFSLVFDSGESMGGPASKAISTVGPGQEIDIDVNLTRNCCWDYEALANRNQRKRPGAGHRYQGKSFMWISKLPKQARQYQRIPLLLLLLPINFFVTGHAPISITRTLPRTARNCYLSMGMVPPSTREMVFGVRRAPFP